MTFYFIWGAITGIAISYFAYVGLRYSQIVGERRAYEQRFTPEQREKLESIRKARDEGRRIPLNLIPRVVVDPDDKLGQMSMESIQNQADDFAVTGTPRRVPWHIRKRELEAAAKTKRKKLESFQEYV